MRGVKPIVDIISFFKYVQSLLEWSFFSLFSFPMWRSFLQIVDIPSKIIACSEKKKNNRCVYTKEPVVLLTMSPY